MNYEERLSGGLSSIGTAVSNAAAAAAAAQAAIPPATAGDGGISTHIDNIYQLAVKPDGKVDLISLFKNPATRYAIYQALGLQTIQAEAINVPAQYTQDEIQSRGSWGEQPNFNDAVGKLWAEYKPTSELELCRLFTTYYAATALTFNSIDERWIADKIKIQPLSDRASYWATLNATADPAEYLKLLARWVVYDVHLNPLLYIEADPDSKGSTVQGSPSITPQGFKAVNTDSLYDTDAMNYSAAINGFLQRLYAKFSNNAITVLNVAQQQDLSLLTNVYKSMINEMMLFIQFAAMQVPIVATYKVPSNMPKRGAGENWFLTIINPGEFGLNTQFETWGGGIRTRTLEREAVKPGDNGTVKLYSFIPREISGTKALGDYALPQGPCVPVTTDGLTMSALDSLIYQYLKAVLLLKNQEVKLAGALSKAMDTKADYGTVPTADQLDPLKNMYLTYDPQASAKTGKPVFVNTAANLSTQYMTQRFAKSVTIDDKNSPTVADYSNMPVLRSFYGKSINIPGGGNLSPAEFTALTAGQKKGIPALAWIAGAVAAAVIYYQYKG